jgi:hypothetical protein
MVSGIAIQRIYFEVVFRPKLFLTDFDSLCNELELVKVNSSLWIARYEPKDLEAHLCAEVSVGAPRTDA